MADDPSDRSSDGTSQAARRRPELDPAHAPIDGRSAADLLAFARAYAAELVYVDDTGQPQGDWTALLPPLDDLDDAADRLTHPERFTPEQAQPNTRPHLALLMALIGLLGPVRDQFNRFTGRHLDFFYREVLRAVPQAAVPDRVHVLLGLDSRTHRLRLPAGTLLRAGNGSDGQERHYRSLADALVSPVQVAQLRSLRVDLRITGLAQAARQYLARGGRQAAFLAMLRLALGFPAPGEDRKSVV